MLARELKQSCWLTLTLALHVALACSEPFRAGSATGGAGGAGGASGAAAGGAAGASTALGGAGEGGAGGVASTLSGYPKAVLDAKPLVYWRMGIEHGLLVPDESGHDNDLLLQGQGHQLGVGGALRSDDDGAIRFDGVASFAMATAPRALDFVAGAPFTFECWARRETGGQSYFQHILSNTSGNPGERDGFMLYLLPEPGGQDAARSAFEYDSPGNETGLWGTLPPASAWAYYVVAYDGSALSLYVNATLDDSAMPSATPAARSGPFTVGRASNPSETFFKGALDEIAIYDHAISAKEIVRHFELAAEP